MGACVGGWKRGLIEFCLSRERKGRESVVSSSAR